MSNLLKDTSKIQLSSVVLFMEQLGYTYLMPTKSFESGWWLNRSRQYISFSTAILLHDGFYNDNHGNPNFDPPFDNLPQEMFEAARKAKILLRVKLQHSRKKGIIVQNHSVQFVRPEEAEIFFKNE